MTVSLRLKAMGFGARIRPIFLATLLLLGMATHLRSDPTECLATPSQDCVFQLAFETANAETNPHFWASGMMHVAILQENLGSQRSDETLTYFIQNLPNRFPDPKASVYAFGLWWPGSVHTGLPGAPKVAQAISSYLLNLAPQLDGKGQRDAIRVATGYLVHTAQRLQIYDILEAAKPDQKPEIVRTAVRELSVVGDTQMILALIDLIPDQKSRDQVKAQAAAYLCINQDYDTAERIAASVVGVRKRVGAYATILKYYVRNQHYWNARRTAQNLEGYHELDSNLHLRWALERTYADLGDEVKLRALLQTRRTDAGKSDRVELLATAAMMQGDLDPIFAYLEHAQQQEYAPGSSSLNRQVVRNYLRSGQTDLTRFIEYFARSHANDRSPKDILHRLEFLAQQQAEHGDLEGAEMTLWRADFVVETMMNGEPLRGNNPRRFAVERLMVERGMLGQALASAYARRDAKSLAKLAAMMD